MTTFILTIVLGLSHTTLVWTELPDRAACFRLGEQMVVALELGGDARLSCTEEVEA